jgi:hypothetical protein
MEDAAVATKCSTIHRNRSSPQPVTCSLTDRRGGSENRRRMSRTHFLGRAVELIILFSGLDEILEFFG